MMPLTDQEIQKKMEDIIREDPRMIVAFRPKMITDELWEYAISLEPSLFTACKVKSYRLASIAISLDGLHLGNIDPIDYTGDQYEKLCNIAVRQNPKAIMLVPKEFRTDELLAYAYAKDPELLLSEKKLTESMLASIIDHNPSLIQYVVDPTDELIIRALRKDPRVIVYFATISDAVKDFYEENYPQYAAMILRN